MADARLSSFFAKFESNDLGFGLPPMLGSATDGTRVWKHLDALDFELMGYFLSCHLMVEHYMNVFLQAHFPELDWGSKDAKMTFAQRAALLTKWGANAAYPRDPVPIIKHLNTLRNRFGHRLDYTPSENDTLPFLHYLESIEPGKALTGMSTKELLHLATWGCCASLVIAVGELAKKEKAQQEPTGGAA
jgi:hypothetical protein